MYQAFPKNGIGAEIGVALGGNARNLYLASMPTEFHLIDCWEVQYGEFEVDHNNLVNHRQRLDIVKAIFENVAGVKVHVSYSVPAAKKFDDEYFDWIYVDANHMRTGFLEDVNAWWPKIKVGGIMAGHDYIMEEPSIQVKDALDEWMAERSLSFTMMDREHYTSWGIRKCQTC